MVSNIFSPFVTQFQFRFGKCPGSNFDNNKLPSQQIPWPWQHILSFTMFYSKFRVNSSRIKTLMEQLEQRVEFNNQPDYEYALSECHKWYIQQRRVFISASVTSAINELVQRHQRDTCALVIFIYLKFKLKFNLCFLKVRSSCSFMIHLCQDENQLFNNFFSQTSIFFE